MHKTFKEIKAQKEAVELLSKAIEIAHFSGISRDTINHLIHGLAMAEHESRESILYIPVRGAFTVEEYDRFVKIGLSKKPVQANEA